MEPPPRVADEDDSNTNGNAAESSSPQQRRLEEEEEDDDDPMPDDPEEIADDAGSVRPPWIKKIYERFLKMDVDGVGLLDYREMLKVLDHRDSPELQKLFKHFDVANVFQLQTSFSMSKK